MIHIDIGQCLLQELLDSHQMAAIELSDQTGISKSQISCYVHNRKCMSLKNAKIIAIALKCNIDDLYDFVIREE